MEIALYHMSDNAFLDGPCLCVVARPTSDQIEVDNLQASHILALVKSSRDLSHLRTPNELRQASVFDEGAPVLLRIGSECLFGMFGDSHCDCERQRIGALREIATTGQGVYVHLPQEAQGRGLFYKALELELQVAGNDPTGNHVGAKSPGDAVRHLLGEGVALDVRRYSSVADLFGSIGLDRYSYQIMTDSPAKERFASEIRGLRILGVHEASRPITVENASEYLQKIFYKNYLVTDQELKELYRELRKADQLPERVLQLLGYMKEDLAAGWEVTSNRDALGKIAAIADSHPRPPNLALLEDEDAETYDEYQLELTVSSDGIEALFEAGLLIGAASLRYEENHYYDLASFEGLPSRTLKLRYASLVTDRRNWTECKFIYEQPLPQSDMHRIRWRSFDLADVSALPLIALQQYKRHVLPVFTHNVVTRYRDLVVLIKRYSQAVRVLSVMGPEADVIAFMDQARSITELDQIEDPTDFRFLRPQLSANFDSEYAVLAEEELALFRRHAVG